LAPAGSSLRTRPRSLASHPRGNRFLLVETDNPGATSLTTKVKFTLRRRPVFTEIDPTQVGAITDSHRTSYAEELGQNAPNMAATPRVTRMAADTVGTETNVATQARLPLRAGANYPTHYSKDPTKPTAASAPPRIA
jgi:hypothetical protein